MFKNLTIKLSGKITHTFFIHKTFGNIFYYLNTKYKEINCLEDMKVYLFILIFIRSTDVARKNNSCRTKG